MLISRVFVLWMGLTCVDATVQNALHSLEKYYHGLPILEQSFQHPIDPDGLNRLAEKIRKKKTFVVGVIGSSVAAGHDNCATDTYEKQLERTLTPVFAEYGKKVEVRNAGEGGVCGDSYRNQIWCIRHMVGDDVDAVHYSWTYFEAGQDVNHFHEMFIRWTRANAIHAMEAFFLQKSANEDV